MNSIKFLFLIILTTFSCTLENKKQLTFDKKYFSDKIDLSKCEIINESASGEAAYLIDEQILAGNPLFEKGRRVKTFWIPEKETAYYPVLSILDLKSRHYLSKIYFYSGLKNQNLYTNR